LLLLLSVLLLSDKTTLLNETAQLFNEEPRCDNEDNFIASSMSILLFFVGDEAIDDEQLNESYELMLSFERLVIGLEFTLGLVLLLVLGVASESVVSWRLRSKRGAANLRFGLVE
jgi:hypothetical protein